MKHSKLHCLPVLPVFSKSVVYQFPIFSFIYHFFENISGNSCYCRHISAIKSNGCEEIVNKCRIANALTPFSADVERTTEIVK